MEAGCQLNEQRTRNGYSGNACRCTDDLRLRFGKNLAIFQMNRSPHRHSLFLHEAGFEIRFKQRIDHRCFQLRSFAVSHLRIGAFPFVPIVRTTSQMLFPSCTNASPPYPSSENLMTRGPHTSSERVDSIGIRLGDAAFMRDETAANWLAHFAADLRFSNGGRIRRLSGITGQLMIKRRLRKRI